MVERAHLVRKKGGKKGKYKYVRTKYVDVFKMKLSLIDFDVITKSLCTLEL